MHMHLLEDLGTGLEDKHAGVEVGRWFRRIRGPGHLMGRLLAVAQLVLHRVAPRGCKNERTDSVERTHEAVKVRGLMAREHSGNL